MRIEKEIEIINNIIKSAIIHGADSGGSYDQNKEGLLEAITIWLEMKKLLNQYTISLVEVQDKTGLLDVYQIVKIANER